MPVTAALPAPEAPAPQHPSEFEPQEVFVPNPDDPTEAFKQWPAEHAGEGESVKDPSQSWQGSHRVGPDGRLALSDELSSFIPLSVGPAKEALDRNHIETQTAGRFRKIGQTVMAATARVTQRIGYSKRHSTEQASGISADSSGLTAGSERILESVSTDDMSLMEAIQAGRAHDFASGYKPAEPESWGETDAAAKAAAARQAYELRESVNFRRGADAMRRAEELRRKLSSQAAGQTHTRHYAKGA